MVKHKVIHCIMAVAFEEWNQITLSLPVACKIQYGIKSPIRNKACKPLKLAIQYSVGDGYQEAWPHHDRIACITEWPTIP